MTNCPCGSTDSYANCCEPIIKGEKAAETAEQLMRARYTAHDKVEIDFIYESTHPDAREGYDLEGTRSWAADSEWLGLEIVDTKDGQQGDETGEVEFIARFKTKEGSRSHHERSTFKKEDGLWSFYNGDMVKAQPVKTNKVGRNDPCPCGSGKKYKKCCA